MSPEVSGTISSTAGPLVPVHYNNNNNFIFI